MEEWRPTRRGADLEFGPVLSALDDFKADLTVITGINDESCHRDGAAAHDRAPAHLLTGTSMVGNTWRDAGSASLDHVIAERISPIDLPLRGLHLGVTPPFDFSFSGPRQPVDRRTEFEEVFELLFGGFSTPDDPVARARVAKKQSVLDSVRGNIAALEAKLGTADRATLNDYLGRVRAIEQRISATGTVVCQPTQPQLQRSPLRQRPEPAGYDPYWDADIASRAMSDLATEALACDRTRVVTLAWGQPNTYEWLRNEGGQPIRTDDWHLDVVHVGGGTRGRPTPQRDLLFRAQRYYHEELAYLLGRLRDVREGDGTLLDNCLVLYVNELGDGATHSHRNKPCIVAGKAGGAIRTGQWLELSAVPHNRLLLSVLRAFGFEDPTFGIPDLCAGGPIEGLLA